MPTLRRYILRLFLWNFAVAWVSATALLQLFDLLNNIDEVISRYPDSPSAIGEYVVWRLPEIASFLVPFAVLIGTLVCLSRLEKGREITALKAAGIPYHRMLLCFVPGIALIAAMHFALADRIVPYSINKLVSKQLYIEKSIKKDDDQHIWIQDGSSIVWARYAASEGLRLNDVWIYKRDSAGKMTEQTHAATARFDVKNAQWTLYKVTITTIEPDGADTVIEKERSAWETQLGPQEFSDLIEKPQSMTINRLWTFTTSSQIGVRPAYFYATWLQKRLSLPIGSMLMILLAAPVAQGLYRRDRTLAIGMVIGFGLGFIYFVFDGLVQAMGERGTLPPILAAWLPSLLFASIGGIILMRQERL